MGQLAIVAILAILVVEHFHCRKRKLYFGDRLNDH